MIFVTAVALIAFALLAVIGGNGYLSIYLTGIIMGNSNIRNKDALVHFFDGITELSHILIFFLLGLLAYPHRIADIAMSAIFITLFITFIARPAAVFMVLAPLKCSLRQILFVSWAGLKGAASVVFAIIVIADGTYIKNDIFHIVFLISLLSVAVQGTLLPSIAKKLNILD